MSPIKECGFFGELMNQSRIRLSLLERFVSGQLESTFWAVLIYPPSNPTP